MQSTSALIHDGLAVATPSMRLAHAAHIERQKRLKSSCLYQPQPRAKMAPLARKRASAKQHEVDPPIVTNNFEMAHAILQAKSIQASPAKVAFIQRLLLKHYPQYKRFDLESAGKGTHHLARVRMMAMYLVCTLTRASLPSTARNFGGRHHTTVLHAVRSITALRETDPYVDAVLKSVELAYAEAA